MSSYDGRPIYIPNGSWLNKFNHINNCVCANSYQYTVVAHTCHCYIARAYTKYIESVHVHYPVQCLILNYGMQKL